MQSVTVEIDAESDTSARRLAKVLLVAQIASEIATVIVMADLLDQQGLAVEVRWHVERLVATWRRRTAERRAFRVMLGETLYDAQEILQGGGKRHG